MHSFFRRRMSVTFRGGPSQTLAEKEFDRDAEETFHANSEKAASTSCNITLQEMQTLLKSHQGITNI